MKRYFLFLVALLFFASGCGKDDPRSVRSFADFYEGDVLQTLASRDLESLKWSDFENVTIVVSDDGSAYTLIQDGEQIGKGDIAWSYNDGVHTVDFVDDDAENETKELRFNFVRNDDDHIVTKVQWGEDQKEWLLAAGEENIKGLVVDQQGVPLSEASVVINSDTGKIGELLTDNYGYFGINQQMPGYDGMAEHYPLGVYRDGYEDQNKVVSPGEQYFITMPEGKSSLNHGKVSGYITNALTNNSLSEVSVTVVYSSGNDVVSTNQQGYFEVLVPLSEVSISVFTPGYEEQNSSLSFENSERVQLDFSLQPIGVTVGGQVKDVNSTGLGGADLILKNKEGVIIDTYPSNIDGTFSFQYVFDGMYQISISKPGFQFVPKFQMVPVAGEDISDVGFIGMADGKTGIGGRVHEDYKPVEGVVVTCGNVSTTTDDNGYYIMEVEEAGNQIVAVEKNGFMNRYEEVYIAEKQLISEDFELAPPTSGFPGMLFGYVYDKNTSNPVVGAHVVESNGVETYSDENGRYSMMIKVYNQEVPEYVKVTCQKAGFSAFSGFSYFRALGNTPYNIYMEYQ